MFSCLWLWYLFVVLVTKIAPSIMQLPRACLPLTFMTEIYKTNYPQILISVTILALRLSRVADCGGSSYICKKRIGYPTLIVIPLLNSSLCPLVQTPVIDSTRVVFPWSTCPAVPILTHG